MWKVFVLSLFAAVPSSTNYTLKAYDFGSGAGSGSSSSYNLYTSTNTNGGTMSSATYLLPAGIRVSTTMPVPLAPTLTNPDNWYDHLKITLNTTAFPADTKYAIAISDDNFTTTRYVKTDLTVGSALAIADYQSYAVWGGAGGALIVGLANNTAYQVKVSALQGTGTASAFGPVVAAATGLPSVTFGLATSLTPTPPFATTFAGLPAGSTVAADATITATISTNAAQGGQVLIKDQNSGITSTKASYTIPSATADLSVAGAGYGARISATSQGSGGPIVPVSPFNGSGNAVGALHTAWQQLASFAAPVTTGSVTLALHAKANTAVPAATDYTDVISLSVSLLF